MVETHQWPGIFTVKTELAAFSFTTGAKDGFSVKVDRNNLDILAASKALTWRERSSAAIMAQNMDNKHLCWFLFLCRIRVMAGAQRYATLWSGDIKSTYGDMQTQVRSLQLAGLSGFPSAGRAKLQ